MVYRHAKLTGALYKHRVIFTKDGRITIAFITYPVFEFELTHTRFHNSGIPYPDNGAIGVPIRITSRAELKSIGTFVLGEVNSIPHPASINHFWR